MVTSFIAYIPSTYEPADPNFSALNSLFQASTPRFLLLKRSPKANPYPSTWAACSGRLEPEEFERPIKGALREIQEETKISPKSLKLLTGSIKPFVIEGGGRVWHVHTFLWQYLSNDNKDDLEDLKSGGKEELKNRKKVLRRLASIAKLGTGQDQRVEDAGKAGNSLPDIGTNAKDVGHIQWKAINTSKEPTILQKLTTIPNLDSISTSMSQLLATLRGPSLKELQEELIRGRILRNAEQEICLNHENTEARWVTLDEMKGLETVPGLASRLAALMRHWRGEEVVQ